MLSSSLLLNPQSRGVAAVVAWRGRRGWAVAFGAVPGAAGVPHADGWPLPSGVPGVFFFFCQSREPWMELFENVHE